MSVTRAKQQVVVIHGGDSFTSRRKYIRYLKHRPLSLKRFLPKNGWKQSLPQTLGRRFQVLMPQMPNPTDARYAEWKIWFERMMPYVKNNVILVGHSLGGMFLAKYLSEKTLWKRIKALILVAVPHNNTADIRDFRLSRPLSRISKQTKNIFLFQSPNDPVVPISEMDIYAQAMPLAKKIIIKNRGHFSQARFPEILRLIKKLSA